MGPDIDDELDFKEKSSADDSPWRPKDDADLKSDPDDGMKDPDTLKRDMGPDTPSGGAPEARSPTPKGQKNTSPLDLLGKSGSHNKKLMVMAVVVVLILATLAVVLYYTRGLMDDVEIEINKIGVTGSTPDSLSLKVDVMVENPSSASADIKATKLDILYQGVSMGSFGLPAVELDSGDNELTVTGELRGQADALVSFVSDLLNKEEVTLQLTGEIETKGMSFDLNKQVPIKGLKDLAIEVGTIRLARSGNDITAQVNTTITNPSIVELPLDQLTIEAIHGTEVMATFAPSGQLKIGENQLDLTIPLDSRSAGFNNLAQTMLNGDEINLALGGTSAGADSLLGELGQQFGYLYQFNKAGEGLSFELNELGLLAETGDSLSLEADYALNNPTLITFEDLKFSADFYYDGQRAGGFVLPELDLKAGHQTDSTTLTFTDFNRSAMSGFVSDYLAADLGDLEVKGSLTPDWDGATDLSFSMFPDFPTSEGELTVDINSIILEEATDEALKLTLGLDTSNPTFFSGRVANASFDLLVNDTLVAPIVLPELELPTGNASHNLSVTLDLEAASNLTLLVEKVLNGEAVDLTLVGKGAEGSLLSQFVASMSLDTRLEASGPLDISLVEVYLLEAGADYLDMAVVLEVDNPTPFGGLLTDLSFDIGYEGSSLGTAEFTGFRIAQGAQTLNQTLTLTDVGGTALSDFVATLVEGQAATLEVSGNPSPGLLSTLLEDLTLEAEFTPDGPFTIELGNVELQEVLEDGLVFGVGLEVDNPLPVSGMLADLTFQVRHNDTYLGLAELGQLNLRKGPQTHNLTLEFFPDDITPLQDMTGDLLDGQVVNLTLNASQHDSSSFLATVLEGLSFSTELAPTGPFTLELGEVTLDRVLEEGLVFGVELEFENTLPVSGVVADLAFQVRYEDTYLGLAQLEQLNLRNGSQTHYLALEFFPDDPGPSQQMVSDLLSGENVNLTLNASENDSTSFLATILAGAEFTFQLNSTGNLTLDVDSVELAAMGEDNATLNIFLTVDNPTEIWGVLSDLAFDIFINESYAGSALLEDVRFKPGLRTYNLTAVFEAAANDVLGKAIGDIMNDENVTFTVRSSPANGSGYLADFLEGLEFTFNLSATDTPALDISLKSVAVKQVLDEGLLLTLELEVTNNLPFGGLLTELAFEIHQDDEFLGEAELPPLELAQGNHTLELELEFYPVDSGPVQEMVKDILSGENVTLNLSAAEGSSSSFLSDALAGLDFTFHLNTTGPMAFALQNVSVMSMGEDTALLNVTVEIDNPADLGGLLSELAFDVYFDDAYGGNALLEQVLLEHGLHTYHLLANFTAADSDAMGAAISDLIDGQDVTLVLKASPANGSGYLAEVLEGLELELELTATGEMTFDLEGVEILEMGEDSAKLALDLSVNNPTSMAGLLADLSFHLYNDEEYLGSVRTEDLDLPRGAVRFNATAIFHPVSAAPMRGLLEQLFGGEDVTLRLEGDPDNSSGFMGRFLSGFELSFDLTSEGDLTVELTQMRVDSIMEDSMEVTCILEVFNPTDISGLLADLSFDLYYEGGFLDRADLEEVNLPQGQNTIEFTTLIAPDDTSVLADMAQALLSGEDIALTARGSQANSSAFLPNVVEDLEFDITVASEGELEVKVGNMTLMEAEDDELRLLLDVEVFNPAAVEVALDTIYFDVFKDNAKAGEAYLKPFTMQPGWNDAEAVVRFTGSQAILEDIVSDHINNIDQTFELRPASNISDTLMGEILSDMDWEITLPGLDVEFITDVKVKSVSVSLSPYRVTVKAEVTLNNPTDFDIGVTKLDYDVYYDDNDASNIPPLIYYNEKYNIFLDNIVENINPAMELPAGATKKKEGTITTSSQEHSVRLNDEYNNDNDLTMHIRNGEITLEVGGVELTVEFEQTDIPVRK